MSMKGVTDIQDVEETVKKWDCLWKSKVYKHPAYKTCSFDFYQSYIIVLQNEHKAVKWNYTFLMWAAPVEKCG